MNQTALALVLVLAAAHSAFAEAPKSSAREMTSRAASCQKRFEALCDVMQRCSRGAEDLGGKACEAIDSGCSSLRGSAPYEAAAVTACVAGLEKLACVEKADPNDPVATDFESRVSACRKLGLADAELARADEARRRATATR